MEVGCVKYGNFYIVVLALFIMNEKGVSEVLTIVLIIVLAVFAVVVVWSIVVPYFNDISFESSPNLRVLSEGYTVYDEESELASVQIERGADEFEIIGIGVYFSTPEGLVEFVIDESNQGVLGVNSVRAYKFNLTGFGAPESVRISEVRR